MEVAKAITKNINGYVFNMSEKISEKFNIPLESLLKIWCDQQNVSFQTEFLPMIKISKKVKKVSSDIISDDFEKLDALSSSNSLTDDKVTSETVEPKSPGILCEYIFTRGQKKGARCTIMAKTGPLCSKHKK